ncbi:hypothetical protein ZIOFF_033839 [Zingiber officinale]|uniref:HECT-type E3 ubiquitin transferase n=1 Tax=Zingiber officinale TaxID=94328 RepID=A0A8J5GPU1_ZINOF|nr:hypothetical protein ZIOFF_033839 [Zingiber officinale]
MRSVVDLQLGTLLLETCGLSYGSPTHRYNQSWVKILQKDIKIAAGTRDRATKQFYNPCTDRMSVLTNDQKKMETEVWAWDNFVGSGVAGLRYALEVSKYGSVAIITKAEPQESNTNYAQGGVSAVLCPSDSVESHMQDTIIAGAYLCDEETVRINSFLEGFNELVPKELISIFNDKELELLLSGLPEIDLDDLQANTEYTGYSAASTVIQWFWEVVKSFNKEDMARLLQFVTGTSKVLLEGFKALQGISGPQQFQIHKAYGAPERLPSAHTCFNQLDLPEYSSREQLEERLLLVIHEASEGFGFG